ncbi:MAG: hypothetical protein ACLPXB_16170 [Thiobacillaceae bacterium]
MSNIAKYLPFVNEQMLFHDKMVDKFSSGKFKSDFRVAQHTITRDTFKELSADLIIADKALDSPKKIEPNAVKQLSLSLEDLEGLPEELLNELSVSDADKTEFAIVNLINEHGGILSLDKILIGIYKKTGEIIKRQNMTSRLYRMSQKGLVYSVSGKKGFYSTEELSEADVEKIFAAGEK